MIENVLFSSFGFWFYVCLIGVTLRAAVARDRSVFMYLVACILFSPVIALIDVLVTSKRP